MIRKKVGRGTSLFKLNLLERSYKAVLKLLNTLCNELILSLILEVEVNHWDIFILSTILLEQLILFHVKLTLFLLFLFHYCSRADGHVIIGEISVLVRLSSLVRRICVTKMTLSITIFKQIRAFLNVLTPFPLCSTFASIIWSPSLIRRAHWRFFWSFPNYRHSMRCAWTSSCLNDPSIVWSRWATSRDSSRPEISIISYFNKWSLCWIWSNRSAAICRCISILRCFDFKNVLQPIACTMLSVLHLLI